MPNMEAPKEPLSARETLAAIADLDRASLLTDDLQVMFAAIDAVALSGGSLEDAVRSLTDARNQNKEPSL